MIGLGRMGGNMARRLTKGGHQCVVFDRAGLIGHKISWRCSPGGKKTATSRN